MKCRISNWFPETSQVVSRVNFSVPKRAASSARPRSPGHASGRDFVSPLSTSLTLRSKLIPCKNRIPLRKLLFPEAFAPTSSVKGATSTSSSTKLLKSWRRIRFSMALFPVPESGYHPLAGERMRTREGTQMSFSKVIVITGASSGIGAELARQLAAQGHRPVLAARRSEELEAVAEQCGPETLAVVTDVRRRGDVEHLRDRALDKLGQIDVWINNAGRGISRRVMDLTDEDVDEIMAVNLKSALYGMQTIVPYFMESGE